MNVKRSGFLFWQYNTCTNIRLMISLSDSEQMLFKLYIANHFSCVSGCVVNHWIDD